MLQRVASFQKSKMAKLKICYRFCHSKIIHHPNQEGYRGTAGTPEYAVEYGLLSDRLLRVGARMVRCISGIPTARQSVRSPVSPPYLQRPASITATALSHSSSFSASLMYLNRQSQSIWEQIESIESVEYLLHSIASRASLSRFTFRWMVCCLTAIVIPPSSQEGEPQR